MGESAMADWSAVFLKQTMGTPEGIAAVGYGAFSIAMAAGRFTGDWLSANFRPVDLVRGGGLSAVTGLILALFAKHPVVALIGFASVGAGFATIVPMVFSAAGRIPGIEDMGPTGRANHQPASQQNVARGQVRRGNPLQHRRDRCFPNLAARLMNGR
jgi:fucose permease